MFTASRLPLAAALAACTLALTGGLASGASAAPLAIGAEAPEAKTAMAGVDGKRYTLEGVKGDKGTLVVFTCNHCPYVVAWQDRITALSHEYAKKGVGVIAINPNSPEKKESDNLAGMKKRAEELGFRFPYVVDEGSKVARAFGAERTPEVFLFDAAGKLVYHGAVDDNAQKPDQVDKRYLKAALDAVVAGRPVAEATTKALGCSIKWY